MKLPVSIMVFKWGLPVLKSSLAIEITQLAKYKFWICLDNKPFNYLHAVFAGTGISTCQPGDSQRY